MAVIYQHSCSFSSVLATDDAVVARLCLVAEMRFPKGGLGFRGCLHLRIIGAQKLHKFKALIGFLRPWVGSDGHLVIVMCFVLVSVVIQSVVLSAFANQPQRFRELGHGQAAHHVSADHVPLFKQNERAPPSRPGRPTNKERFTLTPSVGFAQMDGSKKMGASSLGVSAVKIYCRYLRGMPTCGNPHSWCL